MDVINESFGNNPFPDNNTDPISLADEAAVRGGVTSCQYRGRRHQRHHGRTVDRSACDFRRRHDAVCACMRRAGYGASFFATGGWLSNNLSAFSSGGFSMSGPRTPDIVAPGDLGWALCSTGIGALSRLHQFQFQPDFPPIQIFGGTSESSPLTAGVAALVIQAYRSTHHGADPTPALVKRIIMSTATDLGALPSEQGAGLINALAAVNAALSVDDGPGLGAC